VCSRDACVGVPRRARSATTPRATGRNQTWTDAGALVRRTKQLRRSCRQRSEPCRGAEPTRPRGRCRRRQRTTPRTQRSLDRVRRGHVGCRRVGLATFSNRRRPRAGATARPSRRQDHCSTTRRALRVLGRRSAAPGSICSSVKTGRSVDGSMCHPSAGSCTSSRVRAVDVDCSPHGPARQPSRRPRGATGTDNSRGTTIRRSRTRRLGVRAGFSDAGRSILSVLAVRRVRLRLRGWQRGPPRADARRPARAGAASTARASADRRA
jgi:hypothetical protein